MKKDPHSFSNPSQVVVQHLSWKAEIDFNKKRVNATASWTINNKDQADEIVFDTKGLELKSITLDNGQATSHRVEKSDSILGTALAIAINPETTKVNIEYQTSEDAEALQWLAPSQTAGNEHPFLFTQSQAILARSWIPCQDTPGVRFTYDAEVSVPKELLALMSASNPKETNPSGKYRFEMKQPIPSYLMALAVGDLEFKAISERAGVYAEDPVIEKAAWEFADLEKMIDAAESLYGPYQWERYDVLVLPPSFPFGGMENPRLTFATPTILSGDRSLTSLIAHELAHSWSGNLVTNATWNDFWLNEGFTVYFETRIMEKLYGKDYAEMLAALNLQDLEGEISSMKAKNQIADTRLRLALEGRNPDDGVTSIAYNKGYYFLRAIEEAYGRDKFDAFVKDYFSTNAFGSIDTDRFISYLKNYYKDAYGVTIPNNLVSEWIETEGLPASVSTPDAQRFVRVDSVLASWKGENQLNKKTAAEWSTHEWLHFLKNLPTKLSQEEMQDVDQFGDFSSSGNAEIFTEWAVIAIRNDYQKPNPQIREFLINTGRRKFLSPIYEELAKTPEGKKWATDVYREARPNYHFVATNTIDGILGV